MDAQMNSGWTLIILWMSAAMKKASPRVASFPVRGGAPGNEATPREDCAKIFKERHLFFLKNQYGHSCTSHTSAAGLYSIEWHPVSLYGVSPIPLRLHKQV